MLLTLFGCVGLGWFALRLCFGLWVFGVGGFSIGALCVFVFDLVQYLIAIYAVLFCLLLDCWLCRLCYGWRIWFCGCLVLGLELLL